MSAPSQNQHRQPQQQWWNELMEKGVFWHCNDLGVRTPRPPRQKDVVAAKTQQPTTQKKRSRLDMGDTDSERSTRSRSAPHRGHLCSCRHPKCSVLCINRVGFQACCTPDNCTLCASGQRCGNTVDDFAQASLRGEVMVQGEMGLGLFFRDGAEPHEILGEYSGRRCTMDEANRMLAKNKADAAFYFVRLRDGSVVNGGQGSKNNNHRINHSCTPNTRLVYILVDGEEVPYVQAGHKGIPPRSFASLDYNLASDTQATFKCLCGSPKCRGTMKSVK